MFSKTALCTALLGLGLVAAPLAANAADTEFATAKLVDQSGKSVGKVVFNQFPNGVLVKIEVDGLTPGAHGFHIHETGKCEPDFKAAGGHFAPNGNEHGFANPKGPHAGDLPNIFVSVDGGAVANFWNDRISLGDGQNSLFDKDGSAVIVHENADTYGKDAGAGGRVACGVIKKGL